MSSLPERVAEFFGRINIDRSAGIIAVSGGPDSVALAHLLANLGFADLTIAHVNHQLRGAESEGDEAFVKDLANRLGCSFTSVRFDTLQLAAKEGENLENHARHLRYQWLTDLAQKQKSTWIATGHTADDQAETVLHRLIRGTGLQGLSGIPELREAAPGIRVVRPLLTTRREEVFAYLREIGQSYRTDGSNRNMRFTRNRIRHELLPMLAREFNPEIVDILCRLARQAAIEHIRHRAEAVELLLEAELPRAGKMIVLLRERLIQSGREQTREVFRLIWEREGWPQGDMTFEAWDRLASVAESDSSVDLPGGVRACSKGRVVQLDVM